MSWLPADHQREAIFLSLEAMRTRFELVLFGSEAQRLHTAGEAALLEIAEAERQLSFFRSDSWLARLNREAPHGAVKVPPPFMELLQLCQEVHQDSDGAFDPSVARWQLNCGLESVRLHPESCSVEFTHAQTQLDLGGVAKGWGIDRAVESLEDAGVTCALIHGGTSSVRCIGVPPGQSGWRIDLQGQASIELREGALGVSESYPRSMAPDTRATAASPFPQAAYGAAASHESASPAPPTPHIIDPRNGRPLLHPCLAAVAAPSAALADAWSTALLVQNPSPFSWKSIR